jgi:uncharacterized protein YecE (DUF72 family)
MQKELFQPVQADRQAELFIGCAGWSLSSANKHLFPANGNHLERYAAVLPCVEINTSFYRLHRADTYARWRDSVPEGFRFSVKLLRTITHFKRLQDCEADLLQFLETVRPLQRKWGCLLVQFPPGFSLPEESAQRFFGLLRELVAVDIVCEPRHPSWFRDEVIEWMTDLGIAYVEADPARPGCETPIQSSLQTHYIRLHGSPVIYHSSYSESYLAQLADRLNANHALGRCSWCIFDNTASGAAIENALSLLSLVNKARLR